VDSYPEPACATVRLSGITQEVRNPRARRSDLPWPGRDRALRRELSSRRSSTKATRRDKPIAADALLVWRLHDLRRSVIRHMAEIGIQPHIIEAMMNHVFGPAKAGVAGIYNRATYTIEKRMALQAWADHLDQVLRRGERHVISLRA
jgi:hypothetical protein